MVRASYSLLIASVLFLWSERAPEAYRGPKDAAPSKARGSSPFRQDLDAPARPRGRRSRSSSPRRSSSPKEIHDDQRVASASRDSGAATEQGGQVHEFPPQPPLRRQSTMHFDDRKQWPLHIVKHDVKEYWGRKYKAGGDIYDYVLHIKAEPLYTCFGCMKSAQHELHVKLHYGEPDLATSVIASQTENIMCEWKLVVADGELSQNQFTHEMSKVGGDASCSHAELIQNSRDEDDDVTIEMLPESIGKREDVLRDPGLQTSMGFVLFESGMR